MTRRNQTVTAFFVLLLVFFGWFHARVFRADFGLDEMRNLYSYWNPPLGRVILSGFVFWSKFIRPMGALYYLPGYHLFGLNPAPFTIVRNLLLLVNTIVFFRLAQYLGRSWWIATLAAFPIAYQSNLGNLAYDGAFIYDVLCGGFYFAALLYYVRLRKCQRTLRGPQVCVFLILYIGALDSKEMAVSLPVIVLAYELLFQGRKARLGPGIAAALVTTVFIAGKTLGAGALTELEAYRPVFTWARYAESSTRFLNTMFYTSEFTMGRVLALEAVLLYVGLRNWGLRRWDPRWLFLLVWVVITPLPIAFLPDRGAGTLYIVAGGWALLAAMAMRALVRRVAREPVAGLSRRAIMVFGLLACVGLHAHETWRADQKNLGWYLTQGDDTRRVIEQLQALKLQPSPHSRVVFLNYPFPDRFSSLFVAALFWKDRTLEINLEGKQPSSAAEMARTEYVFDYGDGGFVRVSR